MEEEKLVKKAQNGETEAFGLLYDKYVAKIYRFIFLRVGQRADAEDLTQQIFLNAWQSINNFRWQGFPFSSWLYKIAANAVIDHYRGRKIQIDLESVAEILTVTTEASNFDRELDLKNVWAAVGKLEPDQQNVIILKFVEDMNNKEIASALEKSEGAIRVIQHRALKKIKEHVETARNNQPVK